jgi:uncharacterized membrane protein YedE/YeeE
MNFLAFGGGVIGIAFGILAQRSRFCLYAASMETARGRRGERVVVWVFAFSMALIATQALILGDVFNTGNIRQLSNRGSLSGAIVGGLIFGGGMTLTRACASRLIVLSAMGNLRALVSVLFFILCALAAKDGILSSLRMAMSEWWTIEGAYRDVLTLFKVGHLTALVIGGLCFVAALILAIRRKVSVWLAMGGAGVGMMVAVAWWFNFTVSTQSFEVVPVHALSFTSPTAELALYVLSRSGSQLTFDLGFIPGVIFGAFCAHATIRDMKPDGAPTGRGLWRSVVGGGLMGFGGVLAGGCEVGAGLSGASVFAVTAWIVLWSMWLGAVVTDRLVNGSLSHEWRER